MLVFQARALQTQTLHSALLEMIKQQGDVACPVPGHQQGSRQERPSHQVIFHGET